MPFDDDERRLPGGRGTGERAINLPPAVLIDLDPGNGLLPLVSTDSASPELARYLGL